MPSFEIRLLASSDQRNDFSCGRKDQDEFFAKYALQNHEAGYGKTYVMLRPNDRREWPPIVGYYTLCPSNVSARDLPADLLRGMPKYPMPVHLIAQFATDARARGERLGDVLMGHALRLALKLSQEGGGRAVAVDAAEPELIKYYKRFNFVAVGDEAKYPRRMLLPMVDIEALLKGTAGPEAQDP